MANHADILNVICVQSFTTWQHCTSTFILCSFISLKKLDILITSIL